MKTTGKLAIILILAASLLAGSTLAGRKETVTKTYEAKKLIRINTVSGDCVILSGTGDQIEVNLEYSIHPEENFEPEFEERGSTLILGEEFWGSSSGRSLWTLTVPEGTRVKFSSASGDLEAEGYNGELNAETASGDYTLNDCSGEFRLETASGDFEIVRCSGVFDCSSASGDIEVEKSHGVFDMSAASGDIELEDVTLDDECSFATASGDVYVELAASPTHDLLLSTASGRATLDFGGNAVKGAFEFVADARKGDIDAPLPFEHEETFRRHGNRYVVKTFTAGGDSPHIIIETASGRAILTEG